MELQIVQIMAGEIAHHYESDEGDFIFSKSNHFWGQRGKVAFRFQVPFPGWKRQVSGPRLVRRLLRSDKSNAAFNSLRDGIVILFNGNVYFYDIERRSLRQTAELRQCRNALHQAVAVTKLGIFFGEYGANPARTSVPVWGSYDDGRTWRIVYEFPADSIKHVHGVYHDPFTDNLWLSTGDFAGECCVACADSSFSNVEIFGDGSQSWRPVSMIFEEQSIIIPMDSPVIASDIQIFDRETKALTKIRSMDGPIWYTKRLKDGICMLQTTVEIGAGVVSDSAQIHMSFDGRKWHEVARYRKDVWPMPWFKYGVIGFADGDQVSSDFVIFGEALQGLDGRIARVRLVS